jgi:hypothetical protein
MTAPALLVERHWNTGVGGQIGNRLVKFFKADVERLAARTLRLLKISDAFYIEYFGDRLVKKFESHLCIFGANFEFDSAEKVGDKPIHADHVVVDEVSLYACRFEAALCQKRLWKIAKLTKSDGLVELKYVFTARRSDRKLQASPG